MFFSNIVFSVYLNFKLVCIIKSKAIFFVVDFGLKEIILESNKRRKKTFLSKRLGRFWSTFCVVGVWFLGTWFVGTWFVFFFSNIKMHLVWVKILIGGSNVSGWTKKKIEWAWTYLTYYYFFIGRLICCFGDESKIWQQLAQE